MYYALIQLQWSPSDLYTFFKNEYEDKRFKILIKTLIKFAIDQQNEEAEKSKKNNK